MLYAVKVRHHTPWSRVRCHGCRFTHSKFHSQFHSRWHSLRITLKYTTLVHMRSGYAWTMKQWQWSEWHLGFNSVLAAGAKAGIISVYIGPFTLAKTKIQKTWVFCCTVYTARKTHNIRGFWHEKRMREKTQISYLCFGKWCACATTLYLWPYTCSAHYVAGRGRVIPLKVTYHVTKNQNSVGKKPVKFRRSFKKITLRRWVFRFVFFGVFRASCLATFNEKPECEKDSGFFMPV